MNGYTSYVTKTALDSMPLTLPGEEVSKTFTGSDSAASVQAALGTEPQNQNSAPSGFLEWLDKNNLLVIGKENVARKKAEFAASGKADPGSFKPLLYAALFVVIGLLVISRGFGLLGEEGAETVVNLSDPSKFPGVGHAIQRIKRK